MSEGYDGLPAYYLQSSDPLTPHVGFSLKGMDPIVAENFVLADTAIGTGGGTPGGVSGDIQFNNAGTFGGSAATATAAGSIVIPIGQSLWVKGVESVGNTSTAPSNPPGVYPDGWVKINNTETRIGAEYTGTFELYTMVPSGNDPNTVYIGSTVLAEVDPSSTQPINAFIGMDRGTHNRGSGTINNMYGISVGCFNLGAGTVIQSEGVEIGSQNTGSGSITTNYGLLIFTGNVSSTGGIITTDTTIQINTPAHTGMVTTHYGIYLQDQTVGGANNPNPWAIWSNGGNWKLHGGTLQIDGSSSGTVTVASQSSAGTWQFSLPTSAGSSGQFLKTDGTGITSWATVSVSPAGSSGAIQYNNGGVFGGSAATITAGGAITLPSTLTDGSSSVGTSGQVLSSTVTGVAWVNAGSVTNLPWSSITNAVANLTIANANFTTEFDQTSAVAWLWSNTTVATVSTTNASPLHELAANYWTGAASAQDLWTIGTSLLAGTNGASTLTFTHTGSTGSSAVRVPLLDIGGTDAGISRLGAASLAVGNGTASDTTGALTLAKVTSSTQSNSAPSVLSSGNTGTGFGWRTGASASPQIFGDNIYFNNTAGTNQLIFALEGSFYGPISEVAGHGFIMDANLSTETYPTVAAVALGNQNNLTGTSGTQIGVVVGGPVSSATFLNWIPTSGTANFMALLVQPTLNQVGGTGNPTSLGVYPVLTAVLGTAPYLIGAGSAASIGGALTTVFGVTHVGTVQIGGTDTGISRLAAGSLAFGNGAASDTTGNLSYNRVSKAGADHAGQVTVTTGNTTQAVSFSANYTGTGQPVIVLTPTSDPLALGVPVGYWVTYSGSAGAWTGFTVNIQTSLSGNVTFNYIVIGVA